MSTKGSEQWITLTMITLNFKYLTLKAHWCSADAGVDNASHLDTGSPWQERECRRMSSTITSQCDKYAGCPTGTTAAMHFSEIRLSFK